MSWIQENKFVAGLGGVTAVIGGAILFFGVSQGGAYEEKLEKFNELKAQYAKLEKAKPYPKAENLSDREDRITSYEEIIKEVRGLVAGYRPEKLEKMTPEQFKDIQVKMDSGLCEAFGTDTKLPDGCLFGFEKYNTGSVKAKATAKLNYELGAIQWMLHKLAEVKPESVSNIRRVELPEENGQVAVPIKPTRRGGRARGNQAKQPQIAVGRAYELLPMELSFTASEASVREFLMSLVNSDQYYYAIRGVRIRNEKQLPPNQKDADFPADFAPAAADDGFRALEELIDAGEDDGATGDAAAEEGVVEDGGDGGFADPVQPAVAPGELILKQVLGSEQLHVHLCLDIVLIEKKADKAQPGRRARAERSSD